MGLKGAERIAEYVESVNKDNVDYNESLAAKDYFSYYHEGFNRRTEDPINSRLNYGYAVVRSAIARKLVTAGFHPTFGMHHDNQLNAFNLADDLIEPYRAIVDLVVHNNIGTIAKDSSNREYGGDYRMRLLVILSPTEKWGTKTEYTKLRKFLHKDGYIRIAPEVFMRIVQNRKASEKHYKRIEEYAPKSGVVRLLRLTEKQYNNIYMVSGALDYQEKAVGANVHIML